MTVEPGDSCGPLARALLTLALAVVLFGACGGVRIGASNHAGLLPVVRRLVDPGYLPGDFGIELRRHHHLLFTELLAELTRALGETVAVVALSLAGPAVVLLGLRHLCRALSLSFFEFLLSGLALALGLFGAGRGLELNGLLGESYIQPTLFAHALVLASLAALTEGRTARCALLLTAATALHVQVGALVWLLLTPLCLARFASAGSLPGRRWRDALAVGAWLAPPALTAALLRHAIEQGGLDSAWDLAYVSFRMPHHFELSSWHALALFLFHLALTVAWYRSLPDTRSAPARGAGLAAYFVMAIAVCSSVHFVDLHWLQWGWLAKLQLIRLTPFVTTIGLLALLALAREARARREAGAARPWDRRLLVAAAVALVVSLPEALFRLHYSWHLGVASACDDPGDWPDMCRWIERCGPRGVLYVTPPGFTGFTCRAQRSTVAEFKVNPDGGRLLPQWLERLRDLAGGSLPPGKGFRNLHLLNERYFALSVEQLTHLSAKYRAPLAVVAVGNTHTGKTLYANQTMKLVELTEAP